MTRFECPRCATLVPDTGGDPVCPSCGFTAGGGFEPAAAPASYGSGAGTFSLPTPEPATAPAPASAAGGHVAVEGTNGLAIASLVCGLVGIFTWSFFGVVPLLAIVLGFVARGQIRQAPQKGAGMALAGIVLGFLTLGFLLLAILVFFVFLGGMFWMF